MIFGFRRALMLGTAVCAFSVPAYAQSTSTAPGLATSADDIIVTARKREESLKDVPASVLAIGEAQIQSLNAKSLTDLNGTTPNAVISQDGQIAIRGVTSNTRNIGFEAGAAVYIDGVYLGRPVGNNQDLIDLARVEILRGPQGTLYGKNTTAGAFSLITVRPGKSWVGYAEAQYAELNDIRLGGYVAGPVVDDLVGVKLSAFMRKADGYQVNLFNNSRTASKDAVGGRFELRFTPANLDIAIRGDYTDDHSIYVAYEPITGPFVGLSPGIDTVNIDRTQDNHVQGGGLSLTADYDLGNNYSLTSITAWRKLKARIVGDDDYSPLDIIWHDFKDRSEQFTQEARLTSPSTGFATWILGGYFFHQIVNSDRPITIGTAYPGPRGTGADIVRVETNAFAAYANVDLHFTDQLTLNLGLRYTNERKNLDFQQTVYAGSTYPSINMQDAFSDSDLSPTVALSYKISPQTTAYAKFSRGFKSGGWNPDITTTTSIGFGPESVNNYEVGLRTGTADGRLTFNLTGYYMDYSDLQVSQFLGALIGQRITNAGQARIKGIEAELTARPARWLTLRAGGAFNDARYIDFASGSGRNYAGQQFTFIPRISGYGSADVTVPLSSRFNLKGHVDARYQGEVFFDDARTVSVAGPYAQPAYALVNARIGVALSDRIEVAAFVNNLTDYRVLLNRIADPFGLGSILDAYGPARQFGGRVSFKF